MCSITWSSIRKSGFTQFRINKLAAVNAVAMGNIRGHVPHAKTDSLCDDLNDAAKNALPSKLLKFRKGCADDVPMEDPTPPTLLNINYTLTYQKHKGIKEKTVCTALNSRLTPFFQANKTLGSIQYWRVCRYQLQAAEGLSYSSCRIAVLS